MNVSSLPLHAWFKVFTSIGSRFYFRYTTIAVISYYHAVTPSKT